MGPAAAASVAGLTLGPVSVGQTSIMAFTGLATAEVFPFTAANTDSQITADELTLLTIFATIPATALADYVFMSCPSLRTQKAMGSALD